MRPARSHGLRLFWLLIAVSMISASGPTARAADPADGDWRKSWSAFKARVLEEWHALGSILTGGKNPIQLKKAVKPAQSQIEMRAQLIKEMAEQVYAEPPTQVAELRVWVGVLEQGGSLEGVYNGMIRNPRYRRYEERGRAASAQIKVFAEEFKEIQKDLLSRQALSLALTKPQSGPVAIGLDAPDPARLAEAAPIQPPARQEEWVGFYQSLFKDSSLFTLKRVLGDAALAMIEQKKADPEALSKWYGDFAARLAHRCVDFGLALRNKADPAFHAEWAKKASTDQLSWEVLNRLHRLLNRPEPTRGECP